MASCETTRSEERRQREEQREEEQARLRADFLGRVHQAEARVWDTLHPLLTQAADYREEETVAYAGAAFVSEAFYSEALVREVRAEGLGPHVTVLAVFPDSPAESAGLQAGDTLLSLNGKKVPRGQGAATFAARKLKRRLVPEQANTLEVQRGDQSLELEITPVRGTYYGVVIVASNSVDLHVDGDLIWMGLDLVESMRDENDLAYLCAYALAKNVMRQPKQKGRNAFLGQVLDIAAAASGVGTGGLFTGMGHNAYSHAFEVEADLIALYLLASTGYEIEDYPDFWAATLARSARKGTLSAKQQERIEIAEKVVAAIETKRENGDPLFPEEYLSGDVSELE